MSVETSHPVHVASPPRKVLRKEVEDWELRRGKKGFDKSDVQDSGFSECSILSSTVSSTRRLQDDDAGYDSLPQFVEEPMSAGQVSSETARPELDEIAEDIDHHAPVAEHVTARTAFVPSILTSAVRYAMPSASSLPTEETFTENTHCHNYACSGDSIYLLAPFRQLLSHPNDDGDTALHLGVINSRVPVVRQILALRPNDSAFLDQVNRLGQTALHLAVITNQPEVAGLLLAAGADPTRVDRNGNTPLHLAARSGQCEAASFILGACSRRVGVSRRDLLEQRNFEGLTALHLAAKSSHTEMMAFLVVQGADVDAQDYSCGRSVLHHAVEGNQLAIASSLLFQLNANVDAVTFDGNTPLHLAAGLGHSDMVAVLVAAGADSDVENAEEDRPVDLASDEQVINILHSM